MSIIAIATTIIGAAELAVKAKEVAEKLIPSTPTELKQKHRWMQCAIKNQTQFQILLKSTHFDSGRYWAAPGDTKTFNLMDFSVCNRDGSVLTGVSGGTTFAVTLDSKTSYTFAIGWTNPQFGDLKAGVVESSKAEDGYNKASSTGNSIVSTTKYRGKDKEGKEMTIEFHISASPGSQSLFVINEVIDN